MLLIVLFSHIRSEDFSWPDSFTSNQNNWRNYCLLYDLIFSDIGIEQGDMNFATELASIL